VEEPKRYKDADGTHEEITIANGVKITHLIEPTDEWRAKNQKEIPAVEPPPVFTKEDRELLIKLAKLTD
jgi:hypothetical protein